VVHVLAGDALKWKWFTDNIRSFIDKGKVQEREEVARREDTDIARHESRKERPHLTRSELFVMVFAGR